ncbi:MAG: hypothetical protein ACRCX2_15170 [Paraclostridium sp.]
MEFLMEINSYDDFDMIADIEELEEAQEQYYDEIEKVWNYLESLEKFYNEKHQEEMFFIDQIDDYRFSITIKLEAERIIKETKEDIQVILDKNDIAYYICEKYEEA